MKIKFSGGYATVTRDGGPKIYNESAFFYAVKKTLQAAGLDVIKKLMWKDGHLTADTNYYVRSRKARKGGGTFALYDGSYALRLVYEPYNKYGEVTLNVEKEIFKPKTKRRPPTETVDGMTVDPKYFEKFS